MLFNIDTSFPSAINISRVKFDPTLDVVKTILSELSDFHTLAGSNNCHFRVGFNLGLYFVIYLCGIETNSKKKY